MHQLRLIMNKYNTIEAPRKEPCKEESTHQKAMPRRIARATLLHGDNLDSYTSSDRGSYPLRIPSHHQQHSNSFRSSLYESSLKRLKQQTVTLYKETAAPTLTPKRTFQALEEQALRRALKESKEQKKKNTLPSLHKFIEDQQRKRYSSLDRTKDKKVKEGQVDKQGGKQVEIFRRSTFDVDEFNLGYKNLKEKYLDLRKLSLSSKRKSELLDKPQYRRYQNEPEHQTFDPYDPKKINNKSIDDHLHRFSKKRFLQTKIKGQKTPIYPADKAHQKIAEEAKERKKEFQTIRKQQHIQNFIRKKKHFDRFTPIALPSPRESQGNYSVNLDRREEQKVLRSNRTRMNPEKLDSIEECSPWETEMGNFQRF